MIQWCFAGWSIVAIHDSMTFRWWADSDYRLMMARIEFPQPRSKFTAPIRILFRVTTDRSVVARFYAYDGVLF